MNYRFLKITFFYRSFLENYYSRKSYITQESYDIQLKDLMSEAFGWADFFKINLEYLGNEAFEIVWNAKLQRKWAEENGFSNISGLDLLFQQIKKLKPDVIFFQDSTSFPPEFIQRIRKNICSVKLIIGWLCAPSTLVHLNTFEEFDFVLGCSPEFVKYLSSNGLRTYELNHAFEPALLDRIPTYKHKEEDIVFVGSFIASKDFHKDRINLIENLLKSGIRIKLYSGIETVSFSKLFGIRSAYLLSRILKRAGLAKYVMRTPLQKVSALNHFPARLNLSSEFKNSLFPPVFGIEMLRNLSRGKIGLNIHGGVAGVYAANSRLFEITGVGSLLLTDEKKNIKDFFIPDEEIITFNNSEDCREKILWLLDHNNEMKKIAMAGQKRTLTEHTFLRRAEQLDGMIRSELLK